MSALARYFLFEGMKVSGYDRISTSITSELEKEGAEIHYRENMDEIRKNFPDTKDILVIYTPAVPDDHSELTYFRQQGFTVCKRAEILGYLTENMSCIAIAGTHGKTTVATLIAHLLKQANIPINAFVGGISKNYNTNALISKDSEWVIVEADEFDRSFLHLYPHTIVITSCDPDHLDIYGNKEELESAFRHFASQVKSGGNLLTKYGMTLEIDIPAGVRSMTYSLNNPEADYYADGIQLINGLYHFNVNTPDGSIANQVSGLPGLINVENAIVGVVIGKLMGIDEKMIKESIASYRGVKRRFDIQIDMEDFIYIDDYAHHPKELDSFILSVREMFPGRSITGVFQPHLYSRTKDFVDGFAASLSALDHLILLDIYPARELPIPGVDSSIIFDKVNLKNKEMCSKQELLKRLENKDPEILLTMGAGDIDQFVEPIKYLFEGKRKHENS